MQLIYLLYEMLLQYVYSRLTTILRNRTIYMYFKVIYSTTTIIRNAKILYIIFILEFFKISTSNLDLKYTIVSNYEHLNILVPLSRVPRYLGNFGTLGLLKG